ncbi:hypothetical protein ACNKHO_25965 [Shigella flexneri]
MLTGAKPVSTRCQAETATALSAIIYPQEMQPEVLRKKNTNQPDSPRICRA